MRNFLQSLQGQQGLGGGQQQQVDLPYAHLSHLLTTSVTVPLADSAGAEQVDTLLSFLPPAVLVLAADPTATLDNKGEPQSGSVAPAMTSLSLEEKRNILKKVLRSPQFAQALSHLTSALRDGGLPGVADALGIKVENGGYLQQGGMPLGGGRAIKTFVDGVKKTVKDMEH